MERVLVRYRDVGILPENGQVRAQGGGLCAHTRKGVVVWVWKRRVPLATSVLCFEALYTDVLCNMGAVLCSPSRPTAALLCPQRVRALYRLLFTTLEWQVRALHGVLFIALNWQAQPCPHYLLLLAMSLWGWALDQIN
eukprot:1141334-Pelagomonas_calceolata.AAC.6